MKQKTERQLSANKQDYPTSYWNYQLSSEEIYRIAQYYNEKKNIRMYVQTYLPPTMNENPSKTGDNTDIALDNMYKIQTQLSEGEVVGYLHTGGVTGDKSSHVECFIITKQQIIQPVRWNADWDKSVHLDRATGANASTDLWGLCHSTLIPQADSKSCGSLSLVYLKQLLKDQGKQFKELTMSIPYFDNSGVLQHFFVSSPQVLRYSQSAAYNHYLQALVMEDKPSTFLHKEETIYFTTLKYQLEQTLKKAKQQGLVAIQLEAQRLLDQLPAFRQCWGDAFIEMHGARMLMDRESTNRGLVYSSRRLQKIAIIMHERDHNPGLALLEEIRAAKKDRVIVKSGVQHQAAFLSG